MKIEKIAVVTNYNISDKLAAAVTVSEKLSQYIDEIYIPEGYKTYYPALDVESVEDTWWTKFLKETNSNLVHNNSWSGSTICYTGYAGDCSQTSSFICRYRKLKECGFFKENEIDTIFVFGGTNDSWANAPLGNLQFDSWAEKDLFEVSDKIVKSDYVAMDVKSYPEGYAKAVGTEADVAVYDRSIRILRDSGVPHEFRTTAVGGLHTPEDFAAIGRWLAGTSAYYIQRFVDSGRLLGEGFTPFSIEEMEHLLTVVREKIPTAQLRGC